MDKFRQAAMWIALTLIILLILASVYGAALGAERAKNFFNSLPLAFYWLALTLLLIAGLVVFRRLIHVPGLLLIHAGCILVLTGSMWGSAAGHEIQKRLFGTDKIPEGQMAIYEADSENRVLLTDGEHTKQLPFHIRLKDFRIEYYEPNYLLIQTRQGDSWKIPVQIGEKFSLSEDLGTIEITRTFENFKIKIEDGQNVPYDDPQSGSNPALQVQITSPRGETVTRHVFERFPGHLHPEDKFLLRYQRIISEYISDLEVIENGQVVAEKSIEVNHPLHFGGYHFYQHSYDPDNGRYTVLMVVSDTGLNLVYAGYLMLCAGVFWHFWLRHIFAAIATKNA
jgi:cytochrome c biogenesis protein ResB